MPYGKTTIRRRTNTRRRYSTAKKTSGATKKFRNYRRKAYTQAKSVRPKWVNPISQKSLIRFTYADSNFSRTLNVAGGYSAYYVFRANSLYDPDYTGVGAQPYGFDQYFATGMFTNFRVTASSIRVYFRPEPTYASMRRLHAVVMPFGIATPVLTDISDVRMIPYHKETTYDGLTETTKGAKMKHYLPLQKFVPTYNVNESSWQGTSSSNPILSWYWLVYFYTDEFDDEEVDIYFDVKIKYYSIVTRYSVPDES